MAAIPVAELARVIIVFGEEKGSVIALGRVLVKQMIHRPQKSFGLFPSRRALAAHSCLQIRHEQSGSDAFARDVRYYQAEPSAATIMKAVIVSTAGPNRRAKARLSDRA